MGLNIRQTLLSSIHRKLLRLNTATVLWQTTGQIINFTTNDLKFFDDKFVYVVFLIVGPFELLAVYVLIALSIGHDTAIIGILVFVLFIPLQVKS